MQTFPSLRIASAVAIAMSLLACTPDAKPLPTRDPVQALADQMAKAAFVRQVYVRTDFGDDDTIDVSAKPGATVAEARALVCSVFVPALRAGDLPPSTSVEIWSSDGEVMLADERSCG